MLVYFREDFGPHLANSSEDCKRESCLGPTSCKLKNGARKPKGHVLMNISTGINPATRHF